MKPNKTIVSFDNGGIEEIAIKLEHEALQRGEKSVAMTLPTIDGKSVVIYHNEFLNVLDNMNIQYRMHGMDEMSKQMESGVYSMLKAVIGHY